jgi:hypothetical protein
MGSTIHDFNTFSEVTRRFRTEYMTHREDVTSASIVWRSGCPRSTRRECRRRRASAARAVTFWARTHRTKHAECLTPSLRTRARPKRARSSVSDESALGPLRAWAAGRCHTTVRSREVAFANGWKRSARPSGTSAADGSSRSWSGGARGRLDAAQSASAGVAGCKVWQCGGLRPLRHRRLLESDLDLASEPTSTCDVRVNAGPRGDRRGHVRPLEPSTRTRARARQLYRFAGAADLAKLSTLAPF